jgi:excinuclease ABC subunit A
VAAGTPEQVAADPASYTGQYLRPILKRAGRAVEPAADGRRAPAGGRGNDRNNRRRVEVAA